MLSDLPKDPMMLLSFVNTQLRDFSPSLTDFCLVHQVSAEEITEKLKQIDYEYDEELNRFV